MLPPLKERTYMDQTLLTTEQVADLLQVPAASVKKWRSMRVGPQALRIGRHIRYSRRAVEEWATAQTV
jgi:excisionase family DNA binding protein